MDKLTVNGKQYSVTDKTQTTGGTETSEYKYTDKKWINSTLSNHHKSDLKVKGITYKKHHTPKSINFRIGRQQIKFGWKRTQQDKKDWTMMTTFVIEMNRTGNNDGRA